MRLIQIMSFIAGFIILFAIRFPWYFYPIFTLLWVLSDILLNKNKFVLTRKEE